MTAPAKAAMTSPMKPPALSPNWLKIHPPMKEPATPTSISPIQPKVFLTTLSAKKPATKPTLKSVKMLLISPLS